MNKNIYRCFAAILPCVCLASLLFLPSCGKKEDAPAPSSVSAPVSSSAGVEFAKQEIDFAELQNKNDDIIAWLRVQGTVIDYPVVRTDDNAFYLTHDEYGEPYVGGAIFTDMSNAEDFSSPVMVAYGHFMPDETLFTQLHRYKDADYFENNREIVVFTPQERLDYEVIAAFSMGEENILYEKNYTDLDTRQGFIDWMANIRDLNANVRLDGVEKEDVFLVLSTCHAVEDQEGRYVVVAKLAGALPVEPSAG